MPGPGSDLRYEKRAGRRTSSEGYPMPRSTEFDPDIVLDRAMDLFWQRGYEATSMADLVEHLGIARASIYNTFGSKHELYLKALDRYLLKADPSPVEFLARPGPALPLVRALVERYARDGAGDEQRRGCMVVNAVVERLPGDPSVARRVTAAWNGLEKALADCLRRAQAQGELSREKDPQALARFFVVFLQGLRVVAKTEWDPERFRDAAREALKLIE